MELLRIVPNLTVDDTTSGHEFWEDFLGLRQEFSLGWVTSFRSPTDPSIQVSLVSADATSPEDSSLTVQVADVDAAWSEAQRRGYDIVRPLTHESWGVRRFLVRESHGVVVDFVGHADQPVTGVAG
jgi:predicted enzyme related to lactoylglutathione lyase